MHKLQAGQVPKCPIAGDADVAVIKAKYTQREVDTVFRSKRSTRTTRRGWSDRSD